MEGKKMRWLGVVGEKEDGRLGYGGAHSRWWCVVVKSIVEICTG